MRSKYNATKVIDPEHGKFDSKGEYERYRFLLLMQQAGRITNLRRQIPYPLVVNGFKICNYIADFRFELPNGVPVVEDYKGFLTRDAALKIKLVRAVYGIILSIVKKPKDWPY